MPNLKRADSLFPPAELARELADLQFSDRMNERMCRLLERNSEGTLTPDERDEMEYMVELNEMMSLFKARAIMLLGRVPGKSTRKKPSRNGKHRRALAT